MIDFYTYDETNDQWGQNHVLFYKDGRKSWEGTGDEGRRRETNGEETHAPDDKPNLEEETGVLLPLRRKRKLRGVRISLVAQLSFPFPCFCTLPVPSPIYHQRSIWGIGQRDFGHGSELC